MELIPIEKVTSQEIVDGLCSVFDRFGRVKILFADNATYFTSKLCAEVYDLLNIELQTCTPLTPFQNGLIEKAWCMVKEHLKAIALSDKPKEWDGKLGSIRWNYQLTFGHEGQ